MKEENDHFTKEKPPDEDKVLAKHGYVTNTPTQEKLDKYKHSHSTNVMTSQRKTLDIAKMLTDIDEPTKRRTSPMPEGGRWGHS